MMLDKIGWCDDTNLSTSRLLEPAAGNGEFLVAAARRLVASYSYHGILPTIGTLSERITAFELHPQAAIDARSRIINELKKNGIDLPTAIACSSAWVRQEDFLLAEPPTQAFTHVVSNPPYLRWSKIPKQLRLKYEKHLTPEIAKGDLCLPFLDRAFEYVHPEGTCAILCSDRWQFMAYAQDFRDKWLPHLKIHSNQSISSQDAFVGDVEVYPTIFVAQKRPTPSLSDLKVSSPGKTLEELSFVVRVGPALGSNRVFVRPSDEQRIEPELLHPWVDRHGDLGWFDRVERSTRDHYVQRCW